MASVPNAWIELTFPLVWGVVYGGTVNWLASSLPNGFPAYAFDMRYLLAQQRRRRWVFGAAVVLFTYAFWIVNQMPSQELTRPLPLLFFYLALFLLITVIDIEHRRVPNLVIGPAAVVVLIVAMVQSPETLFGAVVGGGIGFGCFLLIGLIRPGAMGGGDIKLAGLIGLITGAAYVPVAIVIGVLAGGIGAAIFLGTKRVQRKGSIAYAPYLCLGAVIALLHGAEMIAWYLQ
jgi:prepilin signal peptidase PulO-like enzyme (type II secretory pathway)